MYVRSLRVWYAIPCRWTIVARRRMSLTWFVINDYPSRDSRGDAMLLLLLWKLVNLRSRQAVKGDKLAVQVSDGERR